MTTCTSTLLMLSMACLVMGMDYGSSGVYDSPMATDYYVQRFGFLFGGGRSGMKGLMAIKVRYDMFGGDRSVIKGLMAIKVRYDKI